VIGDVEGTARGLAFGHRIKPGSALVAKSIAEGSIRALGWCIGHLDLLREKCPFAPLQRAAQQAAEADGRVLQQ
jgi:hypothetical protein